MRTVHPIETESYAILRTRLDTTDLPPLTRAVVERIVHTTADPTWAGDLVCDEDALRAGRAALANGAPLVTDVRMVAVGITARPAFVALDLTPTRAGGDVPPPPAGWHVPPPPAGGHVPPPPAGGHVPPPPAGGDVPPPPAGGLTRSAAGIRAAAEQHPDGAVWVIGNAPTALAELVRTGVRSPLVIGLPVGFVGSVAAKAALRESGRPALSNRSERGGAAVAAAAVNALLYTPDSVGEELT